MQKINWALRRMSEDDIETYNRWSNDEEVTQFTYPVLCDHSIDETRKFYEKIKTSKNGETFIIEDTNKGLAIGITSLINIDEVNGNAEFIIDIGEKDYWGKGIGREVTLEMIRFAFDDLKLHRVGLRVFSFNDRAIHLYKSLGFEVEGSLREAIYRFDQWHDIVHMGILKEI